MALKACNISNKRLFEEYSIIENSWIKMKDNIHETLKLILEAISWPKSHEIMYEYSNSKEYRGKI